MANVIARVRTFLGDIRDELKQVSWPARDELVGSALVVFVGVFLLATFIYVCDRLFSPITHWLWK